MAMGQGALLHGKNLFVISTTDSNHIILPFFTQSISSNFCGHMLLIKGTKFAFTIHFSEPLAPVAGMEMFSFTLKQPTASEALRKRVDSGIILKLDPKGLQMN